MSHRAIYTPSRWDFADFARVEALVRFFCLVFYIFFFKFPLKHFVMVAMICDKHINAVRCVASVQCVCGGDGLFLWL